VLPGATAWDADTVRLLQYVLRDVMPDIPSDSPADTGAMDEATVTALKAFLTRQNYEMQDGPELDRNTVGSLQNWVRKKWVDRQREHYAPMEIDGNVSREFLCYLRAYCNEQVTERSRIVAKRSLYGGDDSTQAPRIPLGFHKKTRRYTTTCKHDAYGRSAAQKLVELKAIAAGNWKPASTDPYDSEDERAAREFKVGEKVDAWQDQGNGGWFPANVLRVHGPRVKVKFEKGVQAETNYTMALMERRVRNRNRPVIFDKSDPHLVQPQGKYSLLKKAA
jgi:hypothetical protein